MPQAREMVRLLVEGNEAVVRTARTIFPGVDKAQRRADCGPAYPAHAGARKERLDAAQPAGVGLRALIPGRANRVKSSPVRR